MAIREEEIRQFYYAYFDFKKPFTLDHFIELKNTQEFYVSDVDHFINTMIEYNVSLDFETKLNRFFNNANEKCQKFSTKYGRASKYGYLIRQFKNMARHALYNLKVWETDNYD